MNKVHFLGECMIELRPLDDNTMHQSFAGDVYNSAVYLKRCFSQQAVGIVSVIGKDILSAKMLATFKDEGLETNLIFTHDTKAPGIYMIETDEHGERSFTYWRNDSAARTLSEFLDTDAKASFAPGDILFISGISLAVIAEKSRKAFWHFVDTLRAQGVIVAFDPNYRPRMWQNQQEAKLQFDTAFSMADITLPGIEDLSDLYQLKTAEQVLDFCENKAIKEVVVKDGPNSVISSVQKRRDKHHIIPVKKVIDTTSAGDAFNGAYLGARIMDKSIAEAVALGAKAAGIVIGYRGAIAPKQAFLDAMSS